MQVVKSVKLRCILLSQLLGELPRLIQMILTADEKLWEGCSDGVNWRMCSRAPWSPDSKISARWTGNTPGNHSLIWKKQNDLSISSLCYNIIQYHLYIIYISLSHAVRLTLPIIPTWQRLSLFGSTERLRGSAWFSCWNKKLWNRPLQKEFHRLGQHWNSRYSGHRPPCLPMPRMRRRCQKVGCQQISSLTFFPCQFHSIYSSSVLH